MRPSRLPFVFGLAALLAGTTVAADAPTNDFRFSDEPPAPLVRLPFPCAAVADSAARLIVQALVDRDGFVADVRFVTSPPSDSAALTAVLRRWILRPARSGTGEAIPVWVAVPVVRSCTTARAGQGWPPPRRIERPDVELRKRLRDATVVRALRLLPPDLPSLETVRATGRPAVRFEDGWVLEARTDSSGSFARQLAVLLEDEASYGGVDPADARCFPEPDLAFILPGATPREEIQVIVSFACDFLQVRTPNAVLFAPFGPARERFRALARRAFPDDPAFASASPVPAPR